MMKSNTQYVAGDTNTVPPTVQVQLYKLVKDLDATHNFHSGLDVYYQLLAVLNKHFAKLP
jgi:tRNA U34 5-carboxymethylaminomethyl modifying enzyme MnmG/GidA